VPFCAQHIFEWFWELHAARGSNGMGANPISYLDIQSWVNITGNIPTREEIKIIKRMDAVLMHEMQKANKDG
jgi:hypothetical protein